MYNILIFMYNVLNKYVSLNPKYPIGIILDDSVVNPYLFFLNKC
jgi:hypothetical protein